MFGKTRTLKSASNPSWANADRTAINLRAVFDELESLGEIPFQAHVSDSESHGVAIFQAAARGDYGPVADYVPPPHMEPKAMLARYAEHLRQTKEVSGIVVAGVPVNTDDRSKMLTLMAARSPDLLSQWHGADGKVYTINAAHVNEIADAIGRHVGACYSVLTSINAGIADGSITSNEQIDAAFAAI
jgi:hypothetical protein